MKEYKQTVQKRRKQTTKGASYMKKPNLILQKELQFFKMVKQLLRNRDPKRGTTKATKKKTKFSNDMIKKINTSKLANKDFIESSILSLQTKLFAYEFS